MIGYKCDLPSQFLLSAVEIGRKRHPRSCTSGKVYSLLEAKYQHILAKFREVLSQPLNSRKSFSASFLSLASL